MNDIKYFDSEVQNYNYLFNLGKANKTSAFIEGGEVYTMLIKSKLSKVNKQ